MALTLKIENEITLPDGGPISITISGKRNIDIGRDSHLDWTLPDPTRFISSKHVEIRYRDGGYWLHDVSTNGTFLNGGDHRMQAPHRLRSGDKFAIGHYIIAAALDAAQPEIPAAPSASAVAPPATPGYQQLWAPEHEVAPPISRAELRPPREMAAPVNPDFLDWAADVPNPFNAAPMAAPPAPGSRSKPPPFEDDSWAVGPMSFTPAPPAPAPELPAPRRPIWTSEPQAPWASEGSMPPGGEAPSPPVPDLSPSISESPPANARPSRPRAVNSEAIEAADFVRRLAQAAGVPEEVFARTDPAELAEQLGGTLRLVVDSVMQLLNARVQAKRLARSSQHTMIQAIDNNPLKFSPTAEDALRIMFGPPTRSYLDARRAIEQGFEDLKTHQIKTYSAMQHALTALVAGLEPENIAKETDADRGIAGLITSRKAKLWDAYVARWQAQVRREGTGLVDAFMLLFADYYDRDGP